jgi:hypothetical protein
MDAEELHFPDFRAPDFAQPELEWVNLMTPGFTLPDPQRSELADARQLSLWPDGLEQPECERPDPDSLDLREPEVPAMLDQPAPGEHMQPEPRYMPDVVMAQRPGELDPAARGIVLASPDREDLPAAITYPQLYTSEDEMSRRKRHLGMLELGLERAEGDGR